MNADQLNAILTEPACQLYRHLETIDIHPRGGGFTTDDDDQPVILIFLRDTAEVPLVPTVWNGFTVKAEYRPPIVVGRG